MGRSGCAFLLLRFTETSQKKSQRLEMQNHKISQKVEIAQLWQHNRVNCTAPTIHQKEKGGDSRHSQCQQQKLVALVGCNKEGQPPPGKKGGRGVI